MSIELRAVTSDDHFILNQLMNHAFGQGRVVTPRAPEEEIPEYKGIWGIYENGGLKAALTVCPFLVHWGADAVLPMGGIAGVATFVEARGRGYVAQLLKQSLRAMKDEGQVVSALYPFSWAFYRRYGWDWVGQKRDVKIPLRELKAAPEGRDVLPLAGEKVQEELTAGYTTFAKRYRGVFTTETHRWGGRLSHSDSKTTYAYRYEPTGAYMLWRYGGENGQIREFTGTTGAEYRGFLSLLHYFGTQVKEASVSLPDDSPIQSHIMDWDLSTSVQPVFQARVVDFGAALALITIPPGIPNGTATLAVQDEHAPWNDGVWRITVEDGKVSGATVVAADPNTADVSADIQALSQAFWGKPSFAELRIAGRISVQNEEGYQLLTALFPATMVYTLDDF